MINNKKILSVILARKGSQGLPGKNFKMLLGRPLVQWSILASLFSKYVDITAVSSNCDDVFKAFSDLKDEFGEKYDPKEVDDNLKWIQRPDEISGDLSINEEALAHAVEQSVRRFNLDPDVVITLQSTSPCRLKQLLDLCIEEYNKGGYDSLLTGDKETPFVWQKIDGEWKYTLDKNHCCKRKMKQSFGEEEFFYHDNGNIYITDKKVLAETKCRIGEKPCVYETKGINNIQIDKEIDFTLIENILKVHKMEVPI